jgi:RNA polymerase sigma-70 factor (ECF subfamily)
MGVGFAPAAWALWSNEALPREEEPALVNRAREHEPAAFRAIFDRFAPGVHRLLCDLLRDDAAADEATQETFVRAFHRIDSIRDERRLVPWLLAIARNVAFEQLRARGRSPFVPEEPHTEWATHSTPEESLQGQEAQRAVDSALALLAPGRRAALLLRVDQCLPYEEIAEVMGWSLAKVKVEIHRARRQLRANLDSELGEAP